MNHTETKLTLIAKKAREDKELKFTSLMHHINEDYLLSCFKDLKRGKSPGIDQRTKESYTDKEIKETIHQAVAGMKANKYRPQPVKRVCIPKEHNKQRPLGLPTVIDKTTACSQEHPGSHIRAAIP